MFESFNPLFLWSFIHGRYRLPNFFVAGMSNLSFPQCHSAGNFSKSQHPSLMYSWESGILLFDAQVSYRCSGVHA